jgi:hypothetical protein
MAALREPSANGRIIPGLIPGLFAAQFSVLPCFVRFSCRGPEDCKLRKPLVYWGFLGADDGIEGYASKLWKPVRRLCGGGLLAFRGNTHLSVLLREAIRAPCDALRGFRTVGGLILAGGSEAA